MEKQIQNIYFQNISQLKFPSQLNIYTSKFYSSPYKNFLLVFQDNNILFQGKYILQENSQNFIFQKLPQMNNNNIISSNKFIICDFTESYIYLITKDKNEILISHYNFPQSITPLPGILQKKKIKSISCGINSSIFLTYGGMVYSNKDQEKESQKLMNDLLEYNISQIYAGGNHYFCKGKKRNESNDINQSLIFSWGNNTYSQCGLDNNDYPYIETPKIIFKNISIKNISLGNNHTMIITNNSEVMIFGDNQFYQCSDEEKNIVKLVLNDNILPLIDVRYSITPIEYLIKNNEIINEVEAKGDSSLIITNKKTIILKGKITGGNEKIFKLKNNKQNIDDNNDENDIIFNNNLYCFGGDNFFLSLSTDTSNENYYEVKNNKDNNTNNTYTVNSKKKKLINDNINNYSESKTLNLKDDSNSLLMNNSKFKNLSPSHINKYKTISFQEDLTFEELKKDQYKSLNTASDLSESSLSELRNYISLLGISFTSSYNDSNLSFRPNNLPKKTKEEETLHRKMVFQNRQLYFNLLKKKQEIEEANIKLLEEKHQQQKLRAEFWNTKIIPNWSKMKNNKNIKKYFYEGIPNTCRGKVWGLCIGNKFSITKELYDIEANKSIQLLIKLKKNDKKKFSKNNINTNINKKDPDTIESDNSSMSLTTKKFYSKYIKQTLDKEKSINLIDLDIGRTFSSIGVFKNESQLGNALKEILRIFVVSRPDIGYVQGLSYIAGTLLLQMDKYSCYVCFMNIILSPNILPFYRLDEKNIKKRLELFSEIFKLNLPKLYNHFQDNEVYPEHYLLEWFMTLFTRNLNIELALRIWDIYMIEGIFAVFKTGIVIFSLDEKNLLNKDFGEIMNFLRNLDKNNYDEDKFIEELNNVNFNETIINKIYQLNEEYLIYE
jgi:hypothetical protein